MTLNEIKEWLEENKDERGIKSWSKAGLNEMSTYGIGLTKLKTFAKNIKKDPKLARELWEEPVYDCRILSVLTDDPKLLTRERVEEQIKHTQFWMMSYAYVSNLLKDAPFKRELVLEWINEKDNLKRRMGFAMLSGVISAEKPVNVGFATAIIDRIEMEINSEENFVKDAMNNCLLGLGQINKELNEKAVAVAKRIGKVVVDYGDNSCEAPDCVKHLTSPRLQAKLG
ncbi:MAG: DNA alkylation repair protein [Bacteroidetes bacterium]|nr:DNA alkylation repair protein [Bacteroidota bacterium]